jgi:hypothetical protein
MRLEEKVPGLKRLPLFIFVKDTHDLSTKLTPPGR